MSNSPEDIDQFFKENIDNIDVKFNPAHWDKLQKALGATPPVTNPSPAINKIIKLKTFLLPVIAFVAVTGIIVYYFSNKTQINNSKNATLKTDSILKHDVAKPDTIKAPEKNIFYLNKTTQQPDTDSLKYSKGLQPDSNKKAKQPVLFYSAPEDSVINSLNKDSVPTAKSDSTQKQKKKKLDPFW